MLLARRQPGVPIDVENRFLVETRIIYVRWDVMQVLVRIARLCADKCDHVVIPALQSAMGAPNVRIRPNLPVIKL